jgi:transposase-like protein
MSKEKPNMEKSVEERRGVAPGEVEGARRATGASPGGADDPLGLGQRWSRSRKQAVALRLLRGESVDTVSRELGVPIFRLEAWREAALAGIDAAFTTRKEVKVSAELDAALKPRGRTHDGERATAREVPSQGPFGPPEVEAMSVATSKATGRHYGVKRVCTAWDVPRSSFYHHRKRAAKPAPPPSRRGPKPAISDAALLAAIRADLERSPLTGEGHRKVWGRLRIQRGDPGGPQTGAAPHARAGPALPVPPPPSGAQRPRGHHHHRRAQCPLGHRRRSRLYPRRWLGVDLLRGRALERRVRRHPCLQKG